MKTREEYQEAIELNKEQRAAFLSLRTAIARCRNTNIRFYQCMDTLGCLNGDNVGPIETGCLIDDPRCLQFLTYPNVDTSCSFADDNHYVILKEEE